MMNYVFSQYDYFRYFVSRSTRLANVELRINVTLNEI